MSTREQKPVRRSCRRCPTVPLMANISKHLRGHDSCKSTRTRPAQQSGVPCGGTPAKCETGELSGSSGSLPALRSPARSSLSPSAKMGKPWGRSSRLLKDSFHDSEGHCRLNQTGLYGRAHLEPPFDSSVLVKAQVRRVSLLEQVALGASQTTMQRCLTARPDSRLPGIRDQDEGWPKGFSILPGGDGD